MLPEGPSPGSEPRDRPTPATPGGIRVPSDAAAPPPIPDHELIRLIARGSYGEVWLARSALGTLRAVKIVHRQTFWHDHPFEREFKGIQRFEPISRSHEGLVDILQVGRGDGFFYYVMELADRAEGRDQRSEVGGQRSASSKPDSEPETPSSVLCPSPFALRATADRPSSVLSSYLPRTLTSELQSRGRLPAADAVRIGLTLTGALEHLHGHGLVHRDVKPSNVIFVEGVPKLADIGMVAEVSEARSYVGTEGFIPPEGPGSAQADLYSLGKLLYEIGTGKDRHEFPALPPDLDTLPDKPALIELNVILLKACDPDPRQRHASAAAMRAELELLQQGGSVRRRRVTQHRFALARQAALVLGGLALLGVLGFLLVNALKRPAPGAAANPVDPISIFVLPFRHSAPGPMRAESWELPTDVCLCGRLTDAFIDALPLVPGIRTGPRKSGWIRYDEDQVRRELVRTNDTRYLLTGRVDHTNEALRLVLRLYERQNRIPTWAETFAGTTNEVVNLEQRAINAIARRFDRPVPEEVQRQIDRTLSNNLAAYRQLLLARTLYPSGTKTNWQQALANYSQAVNLDTRYVAAQVGLMGLRRELGCEQPPRLVQPDMYDRAMRIMALDDTCFAAHLRAANVRLYYDWDWEGAIQEYDRVIATWPDDHLEWSIYFRTLGRTNAARFYHEQMKRLSHPSFYEAIFICYGAMVWREHEEALTAARRLAELYPDSAGTWYVLGRVHLAAGHYREAIDWFEKAAGEGPGSELLGLLGRAYALAGDRARAQELLRKLEDRVRSSDTDPYFLAWIHAGLDQTDQALDRLERAVSYRSEYLIHCDFGGLRTDEAWDGLRDDPRFEALCQKVGMGKDQWPR
jgi:tetratricopeptide (TPR) repeat protein